MDTFQNLLTQAARLVVTSYPGSKFYEADGKSSKGTATEVSEVDIWRFVFLGPPQPNRTTTVYLDYQEGNFGTPVLENKPFLGDVEIVPPHWPIKMALNKAIELKVNAGNSSPFKTVNLRWPLSPGNEEPFYIFCDAASAAFIFVGTESGKVTSLEVAARKTGDGVVVYQVNPDGTLQGKWVGNNGTTVGTERASGDTPGQLAGVYNVTVFNAMGTPSDEGVLTIKEQSSGAYTLEWKLKTGTYIGVGLSLGTFLGATF